MSDENLKVLIPVDFSETSKRAMAWAFDYAQRAPCELHMLHVVERHMSLSDLRERGIESLRRELEGVNESAEAELEKMAPDTAAREQIGVLHHHVATGKPADEILRVAREVGPDMIVMGTHGLTGVERMLMGSVAERVVRRAPCTVVCVKPSE